VNTRGDLLQESGSNLLVGRVLLEIDGDEKLLSLLVDIANIDTTFVSEEDPIALEWEGQQRVGTISARSCDKRQRSRNTRVQGSDRKKGAAR
jgi:hypothetical protein